MYVIAYRSAAERAARLRGHLDTWYVERGVVPDAAVDRIDAERAAALGLPTLAAICRALADVTTEPTPRETRTILAELHRIAAGEATIRVRRMLQDHTHPGIPGGTLLPQTILESQYGAHGRGRAPRSRRGGAAAGKGARRG